MGDFIKRRNTKSHSSQKIRVRIRWLETQRDMPEILTIEYQCFEFPWTKKDFINCLRQRDSVGMVAEHDERVVGFMIYELSKTRIRVLNFAVAEAFRRHGVGTQMMAKLIDRLFSGWRNRITLEVRETNLPAQLFFRAIGFRAVSVLRQFYADTPEDAYVMRYRLPFQEPETLGPLPPEIIARLG